MVEKEDVELTSPHIKNTSTCGTLLTEHQLETAEDLLYYQSCKKDPHMTGQDKKKKKASGWDLCPWEEPVKEGGSAWAGSCPEKTLAGWEVYWHRQRAGGAWTLLSRNACMLVY